MYMMYNTCIFLNIGISHENEISPNLVSRDETEPKKFKNFHN